MLWGLQPCVGRVRGAIPFLAIARRQPRLSAYALRVWNRACMFSRPLFSGHRLVPEHTQQPGRTMKKLKLNVDELAVDQFPTEGTPLVQADESSKWWSGCNVHTCYC